MESNKSIKTQNEIFGKKQIAYQRAWNKIGEFMNEYPSLSFIIDPWDKDGLYTQNQYSLRTLENGEYVIHFVANKKWVKQ